MRKVAVIGLGRFGMVLARELAASGTQVIAVDRSTQLTSEIKDDVDVSVRLDSTDETALKAQEIDKVDVCVIAIGENFEAALLTTVLVKKLGVPHIICRAQTTVHAEIFRQIGADEVLQPEMQAGENLARKLANPHIEDVITLAEGYSLLELRAPAQFQGKSLMALGLRQKHGVNLICIKRPSQAVAEDESAEAPEIISVPRPDDVIKADDVLLVVGPDEALARLPKE